MKRKSLLFTVLAASVAVCAALSACADKSDGGGECAHTHASQTVIALPTCAEAGESKTVCDDCGKILETERSDALGHLYGDAWRVTVKPTTNADGERVKICERDGAHVMRERIPALDTESYAVSTVAPKCDAVGKTVYKSQEYGEYAEYAQRTAHDYSTANTDGKCAACGQKVSSLNLGFTLTADGKGYCVSRTNRYADTELVIPAEYNGLPVTEIASEAFAEWAWITSVSIPESVLKIGAGAFSQMSGITKVYFNAKNCADLDGRNWAFYPSVSGNGKPFELIVGSAAERIPARLFYPLATEPTTVTALSKITFEEGSALKSVGDYAFYRADVSEIALPDTLESVGDYAFYGTGIRTLALGGAVKRLGAGAFGACESLTAIEFGGGLTEIGDDCFNYCVVLDGAELAATRLAALGDDAFKNCARLAAATLPDTLTRIGDGAFENCVALEKAALGAGLTALGRNAFFGCSALSRIALPAALQSVGDGAFGECGALEAVIFDAKACSDLAAGNRVFAGAGDGGVTVSIGKSVERLPARLFFSSADADANIKIKSLVLSRGVTAIGEKAFFGATVERALYLGTAAELKAVAIADGNSALDGIVCEKESA